MTYTMLSFPCPGCEEGTISILIEKPSFYRCAACGTTVQVEAAVPVETTSLIKPTGATP